MTERNLKNLVTEAVSLDREINEKNERLKELKAALVTEARSREPELTPTEGGAERDGPSKEAMVVLLASISRHRH